MTDEVIPNLPDKSGDGEADPGDMGHSGKAPMSFGARAMPNGGVTDGGDADNDASPGDHDEGSRDMPQAVLDAYETLSQALTAEQAEALSTFFSALGQELDGHGDDSPSDSDDDMDDTAGYEDSDDGTRASLG